MIYTFKVNNRLYVSSDYKNIISDSVNFVYAKFVFEDLWNSYAKTATFTNLTSGVSINVVLDETNICIIPWECLEDAGNFIVCIKGIDETKTIYTKMQNPLVIIKSDKIEGTEPLDPTQDVYEQILNIVKTKADTIKYDNALLSLFAGDEKISEIALATIENAEIEEGHLVITLNDESKIDAGQVVPEIDLTDYTTKEELNAAVAQLNLDIQNNAQALLDLIAGIVNDSKTGTDSTYSSSKIENLLKKKANTSEIPTSLPASDVYDWAKQKQKPVYAASEVGALPADTPLFDGNYSSLTGTPQIPNKTSQLENDSNYITSSACPIVDTTEKIIMLSPNKFYNFGIIDEILISFESGNSEVVNEYIFQFTCPAEKATSLGIPADIKWVNGLSPDIIPNKTYQCSIINKLAIIAEW